MNELQIFKNEEFGEVRAVTINDEPWFVGKDVAEVLGYSNPQKAVRDHVDPEDRTVNESFTVNGTQATLINESGLYSLVLSSKLPSAKSFKRWITSEVLPSIRKHGAYMTQDTIDRMIASPEFGIQLLSALKSEQEKVKVLEIKNSALAVEKQIMQPKAEYFDELVERNLLTNFRETAKELGIGPKALVKFLLDRKYLYRDKRGKLLPYEDKNNGLFEVKECTNEKTQWSGTQTLVTPKGRETLRLLMVG